MRVAIVAVGKLDKLWLPPAREYEKRLKRHIALELIEVAHTPEPARPSAALEEAVKAQEGARLLAQVKTGDRVIALHPAGARMETPRFAQSLEEWSQRSRVAFLIGGSLGLSEEALARADVKLSLSDLTLPHGLARVVLMEQLFRAGKILAGEAYHK